MDPIITTILSAPAILALVTIARDLGLPSKLSPVLAVVLGVTLGIAEQQLGHLSIWQAGAGGLLLGLAAAGVYDASRLVGGQSATIIVADEPTVRTVDLDAPEGVTP